MDKSIIISVTVLVLINITDAITNSVIAPTLIFYVRDMGGTKEQYGLIMSASYLAGIVTMSFYGAWVDANGNKYVHVCLYLYIGDDDLCMHISHIHISNLLYLFLLSIRNEKGTILHMPPRLYLGLLDL